MLSYQNLLLDGSRLALLIIATIILLLLFWIGGTYNSFIKKRNLLAEAYATMDVYLKKRSDLIPNLVETVKGYASHERETLAAVLAAVESEIAQSRKYYNACVRTYNTRLELFPSNIVAGMFGFSKQAMFELVEDVERENVKVNF